VLFGEEAKKANAENHVLAKIAENAKNKRGDVMGTFLTAIDNLQDVLSLLEQESLNSKLTCFTIRSTTNRYLRPLGTQELVIGALYKRWEVLPSFQAGSCETLHDVLLRNFNNFVSPCPLVAKQPLGRVVRTTHSNANERWRLIPVLNNGQPTGKHHIMSQAHSTYLGYHGDKIVHSTTPCEWIIEPAQ